MHNLRLVTISILAAGTLMVSLPSFAANTDNGNGSANNPPSSGSDSAAINALATKFDKNLAYWNSQMYQPDPKLADSLVYLQQQDQSNAKLDGIRDYIVNSSKQFNNQVVNANQYTLDSKNKKQFAMSIVSPSDALKTYAQSVKLDPSLVGGTDYSYKDMINGTTNAGPQYEHTVKTDVNTCLYGLAGQVQNVPMQASMIASAMPGTAKVLCKYNSKLTQAINYVHNLAGYGVKLNGDYSGNQDKLSSLSADNMKKYSNAVKNIVMARSAGEDALYDVMQGGVSTDGSKSINELSQDHYKSRANDPNWHTQIASGSTATAIREQTYMMADIEKELATLIQLQKDRYALEAINEIQLSNLALESKMNSITTKSSAKNAEQKQQQSTNN